MEIAHTHPRWRHLFAGDARPAVVTLAGGVFLYSINVYLATTVQPSLIADIGGLALYAWTTTVFVLASLAASTSASALMAAIGPRRAYRLAGATLAIGTVVCALAPSMPVFLAGRLLQGLGGGTLFALSYSMVRLSLPEPLWTRAAALLSGMFGMATILGPAIGGIAAQLGLWRVAFWVLVPLTAYFTVVTAGSLPSRGHRDACARVPAAAIGLLGISVLIIAAASVSRRPVVNVAGIVVAAAGLLAWLRHERRAGGQLLPAETFERGSSLRWVYAVMTCLIVVTTVEVFVPYFAQRLHGLDVLLAGYVGAAMAAGWTAGSIGLSGVERRRGLVIAAAPVVCLAGLGLLAVAAPVHGGSAPILSGFVLGLVLLGGGVGMAWPHLLSAVLSAAPRSEAIAGASVTTVQLVGTACGSAVAGLITNLAGFTHPGGVSGTASSARALALAFLAGPALALVAAGVLRARRSTFGVRG